MGERGEREKMQWRPEASEGVTPEELEWVVEGAAVVHFWAPWNPYDKTMDGNLKLLQKEGVGKKFRYVSVNTDETVFEGVVEKYHVGALPTLLCFLNGKVVGRFHGVETVEQLRGWLGEMGEVRGR